MDARYLERIMALAERTGDRVIVVDPATGSAFALLPFEAYERLAGGGTPAPEVGTLSREALVDRINKEIATWNTAQQGQKDIDDVVSMDILDDEVKEEQYYLEPIE